MAFILDRFGRLVKTIYFLPHFDDEIFIIPKINRDRINKNTQFFFFFMNSTMRFQESLLFLNKLKISKENVICLGDKLDSPDGSLIDYLESFYLEIAARFDNSEEKIEIVSPAFEGGHNDHDAIAMLAQALGKKWKCQVFEFYLYHGYGTRGKFYRVSSPVNFVKLKKIKYQMNDWLLLLQVPFIFKSQPKALLGLWPFLVLKSLFFPLALNQISPDCEPDYIHKVKPLYERWGRITEVVFQERFKKFQKKYLN